MQSRCPSVAERASPQATLPLRKLSGPGTLPSRGTITPPPNPNPSPKPVTEVPEQSIATKTAWPEKPVPKYTAAPKPATGKSEKKAATSVKPAAAKRTLPSLVVPTHLPPPHSRIYLISSITFPCKHVWSWLVGSSRQSPPSPQGSSPAGYPKDRYSLCCRIWQYALGGQLCKALRLACWNADGVRGRKLQLEHFLNQHGVDIVS